MVPMALTKKSFLIGVCLLLIAFKVAAGSIFIQSAIERAHLQVSSCISVEAQQHLNTHDSGDDKEPVHNMYLMYHVTANISDITINIPTPSESTTIFVSENEQFHLSNIPESAFKPPKSIA